MTTTATQTKMKLIEPHGGKLINRLLEGPQWEKAKQEARGLPQIALTPRQVADVELITIGGLSPLEGFMGSADYTSVIRDTRLANGLVWSIPVTLGITDEQKAAIGNSDSIALIDENQVLAILRVGEIYEGDLDGEAKNVYGTDDQAHPGVAAIRARGKWLVGGKIESTSLVMIAR